MIRAAVLRIDERRRVVGIERRHRVGGGIGRLASSVPPALADGVNLALANWANASVLRQPHVDAFGVISWKRKRGKGFLSNQEKFQRKLLVDD